MLKSISDRVIDKLPNISEDIYASQEYVEKEIRAVLEELASDEGLPEKISAAIDKLAADAYDVDAETDKIVLSKNGWLTCSDRGRLQVSVEFPLAEKEELYRHYKLISKLTDFRYSYPNRRIKFTVRDRNGNVLISIEFSSYSISKWKDTLTLSLSSY